MRAIITGATRGVGRAIALGLAQKGYGLYLTSRNLDDLNSLKSEINELYKVDIRVFRCDHGIKDEVVSLAEILLGINTTIDVLVNNVGMYDIGRIGEEKGDQLQKMLDVNVLSAYYLTDKLVPKFKQQGSGSIFNICSVLSIDVRPEAAAYTISKYALKGFSDTLREELRPNKIKVSTIIPGSINTPSWDGLNAPIKDFVQPEDIANAIAMSLDFGAGAYMEEIILRPLNKDY